MGNALSRKTTSSVHKPKASDPLILGYLLYLEHEKKKQAQLEQLTDKNTALAYTKKAS